MCKVFLEGPYNTGSTMATNINGSLPTTSPYIEDPREVSLIPIGAVDWVLLELRNEPNGSSGSEYHSCFIKSNGILIADDGSEGIKLAINGSKYIAIKHRNHLGVMSNNPVLFAFSTTSIYDFSTALNKAYTLGPDPMIEIDTSPSIYGMFAGETNESGIVTNADKDLINTNLNISGYYTSDTNMSEIVTNADKDPINRNLNKSTQVP